MSYKTELRPESLQQVRNEDSGDAVLRVDAGNGK